MFGPTGNIYFLAKCATAHIYTFNFRRRSHESGNPEKAEGRQLLAFLDPLFQGDDIREAALGYKRQANLTAYAES